MIKLAIKNLLIISFVVFTLSACDLFKMDNFDAPNASLHGGIIDIATGELVETTLNTGSRLQFQELGYPTGLLTRVVMENGEYRDDLFFVGSYSVDFNTCNFYPFKVDKIEVKKGDNKIDFQVTPYIRVRNVNIRREGDAIVATFNLQAGKDEVRLSNVRIYASTDMYVGEPYTAFTPAGSEAVQSFSPAKVINDTETYTLKIDLKNTANNDFFFKYTTPRNFYFRIGAMASVSGVGTIRRNYAPYTVIQLSRQ